MKKIAKLLDKVNKTPKISNKVKRKQTQRAKKARQHARNTREILKAENDEYVTIVQEQEKTLREYTQGGLSETKANED